MRIRVTNVEKTADPVCGHHPIASDCRACLNHQAESCAFTLIATQTFSDFSTSTGFTQKSPQIEQA